MALSAFERDSAPMAIPLLVSAAVDVPRPMAIPLFDAELLPFEMATAFSPEATAKEPNAVARTPVASEL